MDHKWTVGRTEAIGLLGSGSRTRQREVETEPLHRKGTKRATGELGVHRRATGHLVRGGLLGPPLSAG